jgi:uncharacterized protein involved in tolerance to divalent cations
MILMHIIATSAEQAEKITEILLQEKLVISTSVVDSIKNKKIVNNEIVTSEEYLILTKTKAALFDAIDKKIRNIFPDNVPLMYSIPIVNMDWKQAEVLVNHTYKL